ncbi:AAA family ATPase [Mycobacterium bourgelatii]|uniref:AAA family ATPase n=1 Tax=Mycobacterium bourgelatii TaxID=1273442 RepID=UPI001F07B575|nr:AAA family ATPase [Mycobacterium bourgelatii]
MTLVCASCGTTLRDKAKFCDECGTQTPLTNESAGYKQVTVLFADVVRSMDIAATLDIERLREIMAQLLEGSAAVVRRYGGTAEYNGDGVMALFGAPIALEDHAYRACLAALAIQEEADRLAAVVQQRDGVALRLRVGLNSGRVIAGEIGGALGYAATGEAVGFAQRIESAAPPGGVMLSESTARLVEHAMLLSEPESLHIKGFDEPLYARRLLAIQPRHGAVERVEANLVGRRWEMAALAAMMDRAIGGRGGVVTVVGPPGIGKSRVAREVAAQAISRGVEAFWVFCESHASDVPFHGITRLLRARMGVSDLDGAAARERLRTAVPPDSEPQDLLLLDDLLGIADPDEPRPQIDPDARRRRLTALINKAGLERTQPTLYVIEDAHWIDAVSESMLADLLTIVSRTSAIVLITFRPEYAGALTRTHGAQVISLVPLSDSEISALLVELLGSDPSVAGIATVITARAAGNPFFAEEMVRELVQRGALVGERGRYACHADVAELSVPATVQATIEARVDRLDTAAKQTLHAASVVGVRFEPELLVAMGIDPVIDELVSAELIEQVRFVPSPEHAFCHPLIRAVAYESQLKSNRAEWHRRLAAAIQRRAPRSLEENAALIAEHLQAAGELPEAYGWHMRAAAWSADRDISAARLNWERASQIADRLSGGQPGGLPENDPALLPMRIAPRTMLCATDFQARAVQESRGRFAQLRELCEATGDNVSLAIAMTGLASELNYSGRLREAAQLSSEQTALLESIGDPTLSVGLGFVAFINWFDVGEFGEILRWSQRVVDFAAGDPTKGAVFGLGSPLAIALAFRGTARWWLGLAGWRQDLLDALEMSRNSDPATVALVHAWTHGTGMVYGAFLPDESALPAMETAVQTCKATSNDFAVASAEYTLGMMLVYSDAATNRQRGLEMLVRARATLVQRIPSLVPVTDLVTAPERIRRGDRDIAIPVVRNTVAELYAAGRIGYALYGSNILVEALLDRGAAGDLDEAREAIDQLAALNASHGDWAILNVTLLRLRALLARARDDDNYQDLLSRHRKIAESLGYDGHVAWATTMMEARPNLTPGVKTPASKNRIK